MKNLIANVFGFSGCYCFLFFLWCNLFEEYSFSSLSYICEFVYPYSNRDCNEELNGDGDAVQEKDRSPYLIVVGGVVYVVEHTLNW